LFEALEVTWDVWVLVEMGMYLSAFNVLGCQKYVCDHSMGLFDVNCMCLLCLKFQLNFSMKIIKLQTHDICFWTFLFSYELIHWNASKPRNGLIEAPKV